MTISQASKERIVKKSKTGIEVMLGIALLFVIGFVFVMHHNRKPDETFVSFDSDKVVRLGKVSRVYCSIAQDTTRTRLWFGSDEGIRSLDLRTFEWARYGMDHGLPSETIASMCAADATIWAGTWQGPARLDTTTGRFVPAKGLVKNTHVLAMAFVKDDGVYAAIEHLGLFFCRVGDSSFVPYEKPKIDPAKRITCLRSFGGRLFVGVEGRHVLVRDSSTGSWREFVFDDKKEWNKTYIWDVLLHGGRLWVATSDNGVWQETRPGSDTLSDVPGFPGKGAYVFEEEKDGFWCGTPFGLWRYHDAGKIWLQLVHPHERTLTDFEVLTLVNSEDMLWYGSRDLGAGCLKKEIVEWIPMRAGLGRANVCAIAADDSLLWTAYGYQGGYIDRFSAEDVQYEKNFNNNDWIVDPEIQKLRYVNGRLYFGGFKGFGYWNPTQTRFEYFSRGSGFPSEDIIDIVVSPDSILYCAGLFGIVQFLPKTSQHDLLQGVPRWRVTALSCTGDSLWFGTMGHGVHLWNRSAGQLDSVEFLGDAGRIVGIYPISDTTVVSQDFFIATKESGCFIIAPVTRRVRPIVIPDSLKAPGKRNSDNDIIASAQIGNTIWIGTRNAGALFFDRSTQRWGKISWLDGLCSDQVRSFCGTKKYIWIGSFGGISRFDVAYLDSITNRRIRK